MNKFENNPFERSALKDSKLLAGRADELKKIRFILRNAFKQDKRFRHLLITGNRGVGKTSFLNIIENDCPSYNIIPIRINLTESNSINSNEFFWYIFNQITREIFKLGLMGGENGSIDIAIKKIIFTDDFNLAELVFQSPLLRKNYLKNTDIVFDFQAFLDDLRKLYQEVIKSEKEGFNSKTKLVFLIDEAQHIYQNKKIIEEIRFIIQNQELGIGFVFAGDSNYQASAWEEVFGGLHRDFEVLNLDYFDSASAIEDYFNKSLTSIGWSLKEIEESMFYRFHRACLHIFVLTSGKPAWINIIALNMFDRCMRGESSTLKFDRQAQNDIKKLLYESSELDSSIIESISDMPDKLSKWLPMLFACELSTFEQVYFYAKFLFIGQNYLNENEFKKFCEVLLKKNILVVLNEQTKNKIGYNTKSEEDWFSRRYIAFGAKSDTIKQWLQINSDGKYRFSLEIPQFSFLKHINSKLSVELKSSNVYTASIDTNENQINIPKIIDDLNNDNLDLNEEELTWISFLYELFKKLNNSRNKHILNMKLINHDSLKTRLWLAYNFDEKGKLIDFVHSPSIINSLKSTVKRFNDENNNYSLEIILEKLEKPNLERFQKLIIETEDTRKMGIIIDDKHNDLVKFYIKDNDKDSSLKNANFFLKLFDDGHDLELQVLNNISYVFLANNDLEIAKTLFEGAKRKIKIDHLDIEDKSTTALLNYNISILHSKNGEFEKALNDFNLVVDFLSENMSINDRVGALLKLKVNEKNEIIVEEVIDGDEKYPEIRFGELAKENIDIIQNYISK